MKAYFRNVLAAGVFLAVVAGGEAAAQESKAKKSTEPNKGANTDGITREQADEILRELRQIRLLLEKNQGVAAALPVRSPAAVPARVKVSSENAYSLGRADAPLTMVEFTDYQCTFCRQFHQTAFEEIKKNYIDTGKLRFVSRDLPLDFHQNALRAAHAARCAGEQNKFWEMRHILISNADSLAPAAIQVFAERLELDMNRFRTCLDTERYAQDIQRDVREAEAAGATGTPTFIIGKTNKDGLEGIRVVGAQPYAVFEARLKELLSSQP